MENAKSHSTWPSLSFSAAGSSAEQVGVGSSRRADSDHKADRFFTFDPEQHAPTTRQNQEPRGRHDLADVARQMPTKLHYGTPASTTVATASSTSVTASLVNPSEEGSMHHPAASTSTVTTRATEVLDALGVLANMRVQELVSWQQRMQSELRRAGEHEGMVRVEQSTQPASTLLSAQSLQASPAGQSQQVQQLQHFPVVSTPLQTPPPVPGEAQAAATQAMTVVQALQALQIPVASSSAVSAANGGEPARHPSALEDKVSLADLLHQVRELVSNQEALQKSSVNASADGETSRSNEVLDCDDFLHLPT